MACIRYAALLFFSFAKSHSPNSSACRYSPVQSECSPAPGRRSPGGSRPRAASLHSPPANGRCTHSEHRLTPPDEVCGAKVSSPDSADALSGLWCRRARSALSCLPWRGAAGHRPRGRESSSNLFSASSPHQNLCAQPAKRKSAD